MGAHPPRRPSDCNGGLGNGARLFGLSDMAVRQSLFTAAKIDRVAWLLFSV
jgi:hypothetical protein